MKIEKILFAAFLFSLISVGFAFAAGGGGGGDSGGGGGGGGAATTTASLVSDSEITRFVQKDTTYQVILENNTQYDLKVTAAGDTGISFEAGGKSHTVRQELSTTVDFDKDGAADAKITTTYIEAGRGTGYLKIERIKTAERTIVKREVVRDVGTATVVNKSELESRLKCADGSTVRDRVKCRISLSEKDLDRELKINYLPEQCRAKERGELRDKCIRFYLSIRDCYAPSEYSDREFCARKLLKVSDLKQEKNLCSAMKSTEKETCVNETREKVYSMIYFRMYELEERAEELAEEGKISKDVAADFIAEMELKKQAFDQAKNFGERKRIVADARNLWAKFLRDNFNKKVSNGTTGSE